MMLLRLNLGSTYVNSDKPFFMTNAPKTGCTLFKLLIVTVNSGETLFKQIGTGNAALHTHPAVMGNNMMLMEKELARELLAGRQKKC